MDIHHQYGYSNLKDMFEIWCTVTATWICGVCEVRGHWPLGQTMQASGLLQGLCPNPDTCISLLVCSANSHCSEARGLNTVALSNGWSQGLGK